MHRRDLVIGSALGAVTAAGGGVARAGGRPTETPRPADPARAPRRTARFYGQILHIPFQTSTDLSPFLPPGLTAADPHRAFIKAERLKIRSVEADAGPSAYSQYQQICISTLASAPGFGVRHRNMLLWEDRHWQIGSSAVAGKRHADIEMTQVFEQERALVQGGEPIPFFINVDTLGFPLMRFSGVLDGRERAATPPYTGFYVGGEPGADLQALTLDSSELTRPIHGGGALSFGQAPNERSTGPDGLWPAALLKDVRVDGCIFQDISFTRVYGTEFALVRKAL